VAFERLFRHEYIANRMASLRGQGVRRVVLAGLGKNIFPFVAGAAKAGIQVTGIADSRFAAPRRRYRGIPILHIEQALKGNPHAIVVSNTSPVHAMVTAGLLVSDTRAPVHRWFGYDVPDQDDEAESRRNEAQICAGVV
jgi:hypothetical protein